MRIGRAGAAVRALAQVGLGLGLAAAAVGVPGAVPLTSGSLAFDRLEAGPWRMERVEVSWRLPLGWPPDAGTATDGAFTASADRVRGLGLALGELRLEGRGPLQTMQLQGGGSLGGRRFALSGRLEAPNRPGDPWLGRLGLDGLELEAFSLPTRWTAGLGVVEVTGRIKADARLEWRPGAAIEGGLTAVVRFDRVSAAEADLELGDVALDPVVQWRDGTPALAAPVEVRIGSLAAGETRVEDIRLRVGWDGRMLRGELVGARFAGGRVWSEPFAWQPEGGVLAVRLRLADVDLERLTALIPNFHGRATGRLGGELPVVVHPDGRVRVETGRLTLQGDAPAELEYEAEGLFTANVPPGSPRYRQMRLLERAMRRLRLESLEAVVNDTRQSGLLLQLRLRGVSETPEAIVPVDFRLNVHGDLEELLRLFGRRDFEFSFE